MDRVGEQKHPRRAWIDQGGGRAVETAGGGARGAGDVEQAEGGRVGGHFVEQGAGVEQDQVALHLPHGAQEGLVVGEAQARSQTGQVLIGPGERAIGEPQLGLGRRQGLGIDRGRVTTAQGQHPGGRIECLIGVGVAFAGPGDGLQHPGRQTGEVGQ